jgi:hypothetical protein
VDTVTASWSDEELLAALRDALDERRAVPPEFIQAGKNAFAWHNVDAELAQLTYDSGCGSEAGLELGLAAAVRADAASIRALTFTSARLTIELEVTEDSLLGQIVPGQIATIEVQPRAGEKTATTADEIGCFSIRPIPVGPFRLHCAAPAGIEVWTGWVTL